MLINQSEIEFDTRPTSLDNHTCPAFKILDLLLPDKIALGAIGIIKDYQMVQLIKLLINDGVPKPNSIVYRTKNVSNAVGCNVSITVVYFDRAGISARTMSIIMNSSYLCGHDSGIYVLKMLSERVNAVAVVMDTAPSGIVDNHISLRKRNVIVLYQHNSFCNSSQT